MIKSLPVYLILGIAAIFALYAGFTGRKVLFVANPRAAVIVITVIGFMMCSIGNLGVFVTKAPVHPFTLVGYMLGSMALITGIIQVFRFQVPFLGNPYTALLVVIGVIAVKFVVARLSFVL